MEREKIQEALSRNFKSFDYMMTKRFRDIEKDEVIKYVNKFIEDYKSENEICKYIFVITTLPRMFVIRLFITNIKESYEIVNGEQWDIDIIRKYDGSFIGLEEYFLRHYDEIGRYSEGFFENEKL